MLKKLLLPLIITLLAIAFWLYPAIKEISAGVAVLLFGIVALENGFKAFTEGPLKRILHKSTDRFYKSFTLGLVSTAILQSSSLISVITISFIGSGMIGMYQGIGIIFGANIGSTTTAWLVATLGLNIKISAYAMPMLVFGIIMLFQKNKSIRGLGNILAGLGFLFMGIHYMKTGFDAYSESLDLSLWAMEGIPGVLLYTGIGILATVILQSSGATMSIILTALAVGQITYFNAIALAIGANVGTTITAVIGAIASNTAGKRIAGAHLIFNIITGLVALLLINQIKWVVDFSTSWFNIRPDNYTIKLATFHTIFNVLGVVIMTPLARKMILFLEKIIKEKESEVVKPLFLNASALAYPQSALQALINETGHLFEKAFEIVAHGLGMHRGEVLSKEKLIKSVKGKPSIPLVDIGELYNERIKDLYGKIIEYATIAQAQNPNEEQIDMIYKIKEANRSIVEVIKHVEDLQPNTKKYLAGDNSYMAEEYNKFRYRIAKLIRQFFKARDFVMPEKATEEEVSEKLHEHIEYRMKKLEIHRARIKKSDVLFNGVLEQLIRKNHINSSMASSLINDSALTVTISQKLIDIAELLYMQSDMIFITENTNHGEVKITD
ncbi:MAG: Na/Pi symporter [Cyclobacteriaceae bacterium]|nr:Na/Pi symporter [Cyclobacteriaceae bacterium]